MVDGNSEAESLVISSVRGLEWVDSVVKEVVTVCASEGLTVVGTKVNSLVKSTVEPSFSETRSASEDC